MSNEVTVTPPPTKRVNGEFHETLQNKNEVFTYTIAGKK